jgi:hypothetical protein
MEINIQRNAHLIHWSTTLRLLAYDGCKKVCSCVNTAVQIFFCAASGLRGTYEFIVMMQDFPQLLSGDFRTIQDLIICPFSVEILIDPVGQVIGKKVSVYR